MAEYDCYTYAIELGFTEEEARDLAKSKAGKGQDATVLRRLAVIKGLPSMKPAYPMATKLKEEVKPKVKRKRSNRAKPTK